MKTEKKIAIIPARGGSKRVPKKNIIKILGKPLLSYTLEVIKEWNKFDEVYVNSDEDKILNYADKFGFYGYKRPQSLSGDYIKIIDVIKEQISTLNLKKKSLLSIILPTCPLRSVEDIENAYNMFIENNNSFPIVSVTEFDKPPEVAFIINQNGKLTQKYPDTYSSASIDHPISYRYNTGIIFTTVQIFINQNDIVGENAIPYIMPFERSVDIDYMLHVKLVEQILESKIKRKNIF